MYHPIAFPEDQLRLRRIHKLLVADHGMVAVAGQCFARKKRLFKFLRRGMPPRREGTCPRTTNKILIEAISSLLNTRERL